MLLEVIYGRYALSASGRGPKSLPEARKLVEDFCPEQEIKGLAYPQDLKTFLLRCLVKDRDKRANLGELMATNFVTTYKKSSNVEKEARLLISEMLL